MTLDSSCTAKRKCWEHWQPEPRIMMRDVRQAIDALQEQTIILTKMVYGPELNRETIVSNLHDLGVAAHEVANLVNQQWQEMVREPFDFGSGVVVTHTSYDKGKVSVKRLTLDDIMEDL